MTAAATTPAQRGRPCQNCAAADADPLSFDLDLPTVWLCRICSVLIVTDRAMFDEIGGRK